MGPDKSRGRPGQETASDTNTTTSISGNRSPLRDALDAAVAASGGGLPPLLDSRWNFAEQCRRLITSKGYRADGTA